MVAQYTCPRCLASIELEAGSKFCPRCGLPIEASDRETTPFRLTAGGHDVVVEDRFAFGDVANLYRCTISRIAGKGLLKIARSPVANRHLMNEATILARLHVGDASNRLSPFLPRVVANISYAYEDQPAQSANVLTYHDGIASPDELYSLQEVRDAYPNGIDARDMAWIWRRLLTVLGFLAESRVVHTAVCPEHILIEPNEHKLVLIGWCGAVGIGQTPALSPHRWREWITAPGTAATLANDLAFAARSMSYLLGSNVEPAIARHLERAGESTPHALRLLEDFDHLIDALWGPRQFRTFTMPARRG